MGTQVFDCKEGCGETVQYQRKIVKGVRDVDDDKKTKTVYLTCSKGHTHAYQLEG